MENEEKTFEVQKNYSEEIITEIKQKKIRIKRN